MNFRRNHIRCLILLALGLGQLGAKYKCSACTATDDPPIEVCVYAFPGFRTDELRAAEVEAAFPLAEGQVSLKWTASCSSTGSPNRLVMRIVRPAFHQASEARLGETFLQGDESAAFVFYDRVSALRAVDRPVFTILGSVMAHEIIHLLLPAQPHSRAGIMRAEWSVSDLTFGNSAQRGLTRKIRGLVRAEVQRRVLQNKVNVASAEYDCCGAAAQSASFRKDRGRSAS